MRFLILATILLLIIIASYLADRKYPHLRVYIIPTGIIALCSVVALFSWFMPINNVNKITEEQKIAILNEQPYFITWYNTHKQSIEQLDRFCTTYHKTITAYEEGSISSEEAISRLQNLYNSSNKFDKSMQDLLPPNELSKDNYTIVYNILEKTRTYSYKINETTRQSIDIINEGTVSNLNKDIIVNNLNRIYAIEGPIMLDINTEVNQLKNNLTLPD